MRPRRRSLQRAGAEAEGLRAEAEVIRREIQQQRDAGWPSNTPPKPDNA
jgi:hypothetical protein